LLARDACLLERAIEQLPGRPYEGVALQVLFVARLFADQHESRTRRAVTEHRLRRLLIEGATAAACRRGAQRRQRLARG
jgi:hypothetical protein